MMTAKRGHPRPSDKETAYRNSIQQQVQKLKDDILFTQCEVEKIQLEQNEELQQIFKVRPDEEQVYNGAKNAIQQLKQYQIIVPPRKEEKYDKSVQANQQNEFQEQKMCVEFVKHLQLQQKLQETEKSLSQEIRELRIQQQKQKSQLSIYQRNIQNAMNKLNFAQEQAQLQIEEKIMQQEEEDEQLQLSLEQTSIKLSQIAMSQLSQTTIQSFSHIEQQNVKSLTNFMISQILRLEYLNMIKYLEEFKSKKSNERQNLLFLLLTALQKEYQYFKLNYIIK